MLPYSTKTRKIGDNQISNPTTDEHQVTIFPALTLEYSLRTITSMLQCQPIRRMACPETLSDYLSKQTKREGLTVKVA